MGKRDYPAKGTSKLTGSVERNDVVSDLDAGDTFSDGFDDTTT